MVMFALQKGEYIARKLREAISAAMAAIGVAESLEVKPYWQLTEAVKRGLSVPGDIYVNTAVPTNMNIIVFGLWVSASNGGKFRLLVNDKPIETINLDVVDAQPDNFYWFEPVHVRQGQKIQATIEGGTSATIDVALLAYKVAKE